VVLAQSLCLASWKRQLDARNATGEGETARETKLLLECELLREKIAAARRENIPYDEHLSELREVIERAKAMFLHWIETVKARSFPPEVVEACRSAAESEMAWGKARYDRAESEKPDAKPD
jgi:hypothetical protein